MMPNSMKVLRGIGVEDRLRNIAFAPYSHLNRDLGHGRGEARTADAGNPLSARLICACIAPICTRRCLGRAGRHHPFRQELTGLDQKGGRVTLTFRRRLTAEADAVIGADGVHSLVRDIIVGPDKPIHRAVSPTALCFRPAAERQRHRQFANEMVGPGPAHRHLLHHAAKGEIYFVTSVPESADWMTQQIVVGKRRRRRIARAPTKVSIPTCAMCSTPGPTATNGRSSSASRCRAGATAVSCCSAMHAIR